MKEKEVFFVLGRLGGEGWGGAHRVVCILANYLAQKGYSVTIIVWRDSSIDYPLLDSVKIDWLHCVVKNEWDMIKPCLETRKRLKGHEGAYLYAFMSRMATYAILYTIGEGIKIIGSERTDPRTEPHNAFFRWIRNQAFGFLYRAVYQTPEAMAYFPKRAQKIWCVIPNPIMPGIPERFEKERRKEFVTFCRIDKQKNLPMMIDAFEIIHHQFPEYTLRIYGKGLMEQEVKEYIRSKKADSYIFMEGFSNNIHALVRDAAGFLSTSNYEGLSNSMLESLAMGLPCVCTDCPIGGARMVIENGVNGLLVPVGDVAAMAEAIRKLIENPGWSERISVNALRIKDELSEQIICQKWERLMYEKKAQ